MKKVGYVLVGDWGRGQLRLVIVEVKGNVKVLRNLWLKRIVNLRVSIEVWDVSGPSGGGSLKSSWSYNGLDTSSDLSPEGDLPGATAVEAIKTDLKKVAVGYQTAVIKIFEIESGKELAKFRVDPVDGGKSL